MKEPWAGPKLKTKQWKIEKETDDLSRETEILMGVANHWKLDWCVEVFLDQFKQFINIASAGFDGLIALDGKNQTKQVADPATLL